MNEPRVTVYVGLGSNLDGPLDRLRRALRELERIPATRMRRSSSLFWSEPVGPPGQPVYANAVAELETGLSPIDLLDQLQRIEAAHDRVRAERWGPRTLDLDILLYGDRQIDLPRLRVPHPEIARRSFVLHPLAEIAPSGLRIPGLGTLEALLAACPPVGLERA